MCNRVEGQQATDATHSELEQLRERNDFLATMLAGADATMFELEQVIPRNESDRDYSETVTKAFESLRERVRELEAENRSEQMRHTGGMLSMVLDEQSLTADLTKANQRIAELELLLKGANATLGELEQVIPRNESDRDYCETVANRIAELEDTAILFEGAKQEVARLATQLTAANEKCERLEQTARNYEELRKVIDGGSESMTHDNAVREVRDLQGRYERLERGVERLDSGVPFVYGQAGTLREAINKLGGEL